MNSLTSLSEPPFDCSTHVLVVALKGTVLTLPGMYTFYVTSADSEAQRLAHA